MEEKTFKELYEERKNQKKLKKLTPAQAFIAEVAALTMKSEVTVRMWLNGTQAPDELAQSVIAKHFGVRAEILFPKKKTEKTEE